MLLKNSWVKIVDSSSLIDNEYWRRPHVSDVIAKSKHERNNNSDLKIIILKRRKLEWKIF